MIIIKKEKLNILKSSDGKLLKAVNDNGKTLEDGTIIEPYRTDTIYLNKSITTLEQASKIYTEEDI